MRYPLIWCLALPVTLAACTGAQPTTPPAPTPSVPVRQTASDDDCAARLHDLSEYLMLYVAVRHQLPPSLESLRTVSGGKPVPLTCPVSNLPYVYHPQGLHAEGDRRVLIAYDPTPVHDGKRQALLLTLPEGGKALVIDTVLITDEILKAFRPAGPVSQPKDAGRP